MSKILVKTNFNDKDELGRVDWNLYFIAMTYMVALRSFDTSTKCGCIATRNNVILSTGFNGAPSGANDQEVPINVRPDKYWYMEHSERNAIYNAAKNGINLKGCTFYVTGAPCIDCMRGMLSIQPKEIIYCVGNNTKMNNYKQDIGDAEKYLEIMAPNTKIIEYSSTKVITQITDFIQSISNNVITRFTSR